MTIISEKNFDITKKTKILYQNIDHNKFHILVGYVLWLINPFRLFNAKSCLDIYILDIYDL